MANTTETFQITAEQAELYESRFVPAIFGEWAPHLVDAAGLAPGMTVLDVACGTGIVARTAAERLGGSGRVVGLDRNDAMLVVARRLRPDLEWRQGDAASLPFPDGAFDAVLCQSALMFFPDREAALREMGRVAAAGGTVAVQVFDQLAAQPGYGPFVEVAARHAGPEALSLLGAYWVHGDLDVLAGRFASAGLRVATTRTRLGAVRFSSVDEFVATEVYSTPLAGRIDERVYGRILEDSREALARFRTGSGVEVPIRGHLVTAHPTGR
jgi:SAM-dependent methyltransferase